jgi:hypothetical protein
MVRLEKLKKQMKDKEEPKKDEMPSPPPPPIESTETVVPDEGKRNLKIIKFYLFQVNIIFYFF